MSERRSEQFRTSVPGHVMQRGVKMGVVECRPFFFHRIAPDEFGDAKSKLHSNYLHSSKLHSNYLHSSKIHSIKLLHSSKLHSNYLHSSKTHSNKLLLISQPLLTNKLLHSSKHAFLLSQGNVPGDCLKLPRRIRSEWLEANHHEKN
ncbi:uncharacterized protein LOC144007872 [Festucalex cinctus]